MTGRRQKGKSMKRLRSWHHRGVGPDRAFRTAVGRLDRALQRAEEAIRDVREAPDET